MATPSISRKVAKSPACMPFTLNAANAARPAPAGVSGGGPSKVRSCVRDILPNVSHKRPVI
jgi:hypothetical protein